MTPSEPSLAHEVLSDTHQNAFLCYQCQRCSAGCPLADRFDLLPSEIMRGIQEGDSSVLRARTVWLCASCQTCNTRCPQGLDLPRIIDHLRARTSRRPSVPETARFFRAFLRHVGVFGRVFEAGLVAELNLRDGNPFRDLGLGFRMIRKGKIGLLPQVAWKHRRRRSARRENAVAYYPGCSLHSTGAAFDRSLRAVAQALGLELVEVPGWTCCGATPAHGSDPLLAVTLPLRNLLAVEEMGLDRMVAPCASCYGRFRSALAQYREEGDLAEAAESKLGHGYRDTIRVFNAPDALLDVDPRVLARRVVVRLSGLNVACYYGCLLSRPPRNGPSAETENPSSLDRLIRAVGAHPVDWSRKTDCCGGSLAVTHPEIAMQLSAEVLRDAHERGADLIATACPLCQVNLDERQPQMASELGFSIPVVYVTQLLAYAFGLGAEARSFDQLGVPVEPVLDARRAGA